MARVVYITSEHLRNESEKVAVIKQRASMVHELINAYGLEKYMQVRVPRQASESDLALFHSGLYISYLKRNNKNNEKCDDDDDDDSDDAEVDDEQMEYGLGYDCPKIENLWEFAVCIAGGTLSAVETVLNGSKIAINWCGGWHHAQRDEAEGFCYINDIGIGIQKLREKFKRIFYIDLDVHHGNGVENAFAFTKRVFTLSFHQQEAGFFPGTGFADDCGLGSGRGYCANFPYKSGVTGLLFVKYFVKVVNLILNIYKPDVCVVQCGGDVITGDPLGGANLTPPDLGKCIEETLKWNMPKIYLGGGGYNRQNTSRYWAYLTSIICGKKIADDIPDNEYFLEYGPGYDLSIVPRCVPDSNTEEAFSRNFQQIQENMKKYNVCDN